MSTSLPAPRLSTLPPPAGRYVAVLGGLAALVVGGAAFLAQVASILEEGDHFLLGTDLVKDTDRLVAAYDDSDGVTARFNKNVLRILNRDLDADFDLERWQPWRVGQDLHLDVGDVGHRVDGELPGRAHAEYAHQQDKENHQEAVADGGLDDPRDPSF